MCMKTCACSGVVRWQVGTSVCTSFRLEPPNECAFAAMFEVRAALGVRAGDTAVNAVNFWGLAGVLLGVAMPGSRQGHGLDCAHENCCVLEDAPCWVCAC